MVQKYRFLVFLCLSLGLGVLVSCYKEPSFSLSPEISFSKIEKFVRLDQFTGARKDSIILSINFTDGDGDLGINAEEIGRQFKASDYNYLVSPFRKNKGKTESFVPLETFSGFFPKLKTDNKLGPIEGKLSYRIQIETAFWPKVRDTLSFEVRIKDRSGNLSNTIVTEPIVVNIK
jgi:hypothetical protein